MKTFKIEDKIFKTETLFIIGKYDEANEYLKKKFNYEGELDEMVIGSVIKIPNKKDDYFFRVLWVEDAKNIPLVVHEMFHLVVRICQDKQVPIKANIETGECGDETAAYLLEFYLEQFNLKTMPCKSNKKKKKK
jgi:hypothetical protein